MSERAFKRLLGPLAAYLSQEAFVFGQQTSSVLHGDVQSSPVELHEGDGELEAAEREEKSAYTPAKSSQRRSRGSGAHVWS